MTDECISPLRQRMIEDMSLRHFGGEDAEGLHPGRQEPSRSFLADRPTRRQPRICGFSSCT